LVHPTYGGVERSLISILRGGLENFLSETYLTEIPFKNVGIFGEDGISVNVSGDAKFEIGKLRWM
jgi:hypothetical protein